MRACLLLTVLAGLLTAATAGAGAQQAHRGEALHVKTQRPTQGPVDLAAATEAVVRGVNAFRAAKGLQELETDPKLAEAAQGFADFMASADKYGHQADGSTPAQRARDHGYDYCIVAENIAYQFDSTGFTTDALATAFVEGWKGSPEHRENMLSPVMTETGAGAALSRQSGRYYAVQLFGRPASASIEFRLANDADTLVEYAVGERTFELPPRFTRRHRECRPAAIDLRWPGQQEDITIRPSDGDRYRILRRDGRLRVERE